VNYASAASAAEAVVGEVQSAGGRAIAVQADIGKVEDVERLFATVDDELGPLHGLVNNAGLASAT
jgi:NAD(P)-dependent dehydrogenase (short-subunit alcohol dehydrogenase family)